MQDLPGCVWDLRLFPKISSVYISLARAKGGARRHGTKLQTERLYMIQESGGEAGIFTEGKRAAEKQVAYYMNNANVIYVGLKSAGYRCIGRRQCPRISS